MAQGSALREPDAKALPKETFQLAGVSFESLTDNATSQILQNITSEPDQSAVTMRDLPKIAVFAPHRYAAYSDPVLLVLQYANIPYTIVNDRDVLDGKLQDFDWLHMHDEDYTGAFGRYQHSHAKTDWYQKEVQHQKDLAAGAGYTKVSEMKRDVAIIISEFAQNGGYLFAMCSATDTYEIALAAQETDICDETFDGDGIAEDMEDKLNLVNMEGKTIQVHYPNVANGKGQLELDVSQLPNGVYILVAKDSHNRSTYKKLVVQ